MERWVGKVALVTGASSGIGRATSVLLAKNGVTVVGCARREEKLNELVGVIKNEGKFIPYKCDIVNEAELHAMFDWIETNVGVVSILINNAGITRFGTIMDSPLELIMPVLETNLLSVIRATKEAIKRMKKHQVDGHIVFVNSLTGHYLPESLKNINLYPVAKHGITAIIKVLKQELAIEGSKIKISSISPGAVDTEIIDQDPNHRGVKHLWANIPLLKPEDVGNAILYVLCTPPHVQVYELMISPVGEKF